MFVSLTRAVNELVGNQISSWVGVGALVQIYILVSLNIQPKSSLTNFKGMILVDQGIKKRMHCAFYKAAKLQSRMGWLGVQDAGGAHRYALACRTNRSSCRVQSSQLEHLY